MILPLSTHAGSLAVLKTPCCAQDNNIVRVIGPT